MSIYDSLRSFSVSIRCSTGDGEIASQVALLSPDETFADLHRDGQAAWEGVELRRRPGMWHFLYRGIVAGNASGDPVDLARAVRITKAFTLPYSSLRIRQADLYDDAGFCGSCGNAYCFDHWNVSRSGASGSCPQGHWKSLDPNWSPDD